MKIVILTNGNISSVKLSNILHSNNIPFRVYTISYALPKKYTLAQYYYKKITTINFIHRLKNITTLSYPTKTYYIGVLNSPKMVSILQKYSPNYILMMGGGIMNSEVIHTATNGVLNAHPGLLPFIRGVDAIKHSILKDIPIGVSTHFIDDGIDTGQIIERYYLPIFENTELDEVFREINNLCVSAIAKITFDIINGKPLKKSKQSNIYPLCRKLNHEQSIEAVEKFNRKWYLIHNEKIKKYPDIVSGKNLLYTYKKNEIVNNPIKIK